MTTCAISIYKMLTREIESEAVLKTDTQVLS